LAVFRPSRFATSAGLSRLAFRACVGLAVVLFIVQGVLANITSVGPHGGQVDGLGNRVYPAPSWSHLFGETEYWNGPRLFVVQRVSFSGTIGLLSVWSAARRKTEDDVNETDWVSEA